jgi:hypothetical protein
VESRQAPKIAIVPLDPIGSWLIGCGPLPESTNIELMVGGEQAVGLKSAISLVVSGGTSTGALQAPLTPIHGS